MNNKKFWILEVTQVIVLIAVLFCWRSVRNEDIEMSSSEELYYRETEATEEVFENLSQNTETEMEMENEVETESSEISYEEDSAEANNRLTITTLAKDGAIPTVDGKTYQERQGAFDQLEWDTITGKAIEEDTQSSLIISPTHGHHAPQLQNSCQWRGNPKILIKKCSRQGLNFYSVLCSTHNG